MEGQRVDWSGKQKKRIPVVTSSAATNLCIQKVLRLVPILSCFGMLHDNKAGYTALGAPKHLYKRKRYGPTDGRADGQKDPLKEMI